MNKRYYVFFILAAVACTSVIVSVWVARRHGDEYSRSLSVVKSLGGWFTPDKRPFYTTIIVDLSETAISDQDMQKLSGLRFAKAMNLNLSNTEITDASIPILETFPLGLLNVRGTKISRNGTVRLLKSDDSLEIESDYSDVDR